MPNFDDWDKTKGKAPPLYGEDAFSRPASHDQPPSSAKLGTFPSREDSPIQDAFNVAPLSAKTRALMWLDQVHQELEPRLAGGGLVGKMSLVREAADTFLKMVVGNWPRLYDQVSPWALTIQKWAYRHHLTGEEAKIANNEVKVTFEAFESFLDDMTLPGGMKLPKSVRDAISKAFAAICDAVKVDIKNAQG